METHVSNHRDDLGKFYWIVMEKEKTESPMKQKRRTTQQTVRREGEREGEREREKKKSRFGRLQSQSRRRAAARTAAIQRECYRARHDKNRRDYGSVL